jgi:Mycothiol maleylpyruvate isomerase N-terminal domain
VRQWRAIARAIPSCDLDAPSRVRGWRNREVIAHLSMQPGLLVRFLSSAGSEPPRLDAGENLSGTRNLADLVDAATREAALAGKIDFGVRSERAVAVLVTADLEATITTLQGAILVRDYLVTRCVEAVVHRLDLVPAVEPDPSAQTVAADALVALLATRDATLVDTARAMPPERWLAIATGRERAPAAFEGVVPLMG